MTEKRINEFRLYISGHNSDTDRAISNFNKLLDLRFSGDYSLDVINMLLNPERAIRDDIIVTPTLVKISPPPEKKVFGDIKAMERFLDLLLS